jgi:hypothetical protein
MQELLAKLAAVRGKIDSAYSDMHEEVPMEVRNAIDVKVSELENRLKRRDLVREALT